MIASTALADTAPASVDNWQSAFSALGPAFVTPVMAEPMPAPQWVARSEAVAHELGLDADWFASDEALQVFSGNAPLNGRVPVASVYSGHQFGVWAGQLGDGRALLLGERNGLEVQLKGAGRTPYSRMGDGRAVLRSSIREFLCSEAMQALGVPTSRALCVTGSALPVQRETIETAAVLTRAAPSFIRFGHFEHFRQQPGGEDALRRLADFVIDTRMPECRDAANPYAALLETVTRRTARLMADWMAVGFCHGVMNTDNMSILGLTIDYGPFGFLDAFDPGHICNHTDTRGRYAWNAQPNVAFWNLHALAHALVSLIGDGDLALETLKAYQADFADTLAARWRAKLGLQTSRDDDRALLDDLLRLMATDRSDFTITFRRLAGFVPGGENAAQRDLFIDRAAFDAWGARYAARLAREGSIDAERALRMNLANPKYVLRNHLAEQAIRAAQAGEFDEIARLLKVLQHPFDEQDADTSARYAGFPPVWAQHLEVSCSS